MHLILLADGNKFGQAPFPTGRLAGPVGQTTMALSQRYNVAEGEILLPALAVAGGIAGTWGRVDTSWGHRSLPSSILAFISTPAGSDLSRAIEHLVAPVRTRQKMLIGRFNSVNPAEIQAEKTKAQRRLLQLHNRAPDDNELFLCNRMIRGLRLYEAPLIFTDSLRTNDLLGNLLACADASLFAFGDASVVEARPGSSNDVDLALISRLLRAETLIERYGSDRVMLSEPTVGGILLGSFEDFVPLLGQARSLQLLAGSTVLLNSLGGSSRVTAACHSPLAEQTEWNEQIEYIFECRPYLDPPRLSEDARRHLLAFRNTILDSLPNYPASTHSLLFSFHELACRFSIALHFASCRDRDISLQTADVAIALAQYYGCKQAALWAELQTNIVTNPDDEQAAVEIMFAKIRLKGPIGRRELFRSFHDQRTAVHEPVIRKLLERGAVVEASNGCLSLAQNAYEI